MSDILKTRAKTYWGKLSYIHTGMLNEELEGNTEEDDWLKAEILLKQSIDLLEVFISKQGGTLK